MNKDDVLSALPALTRPELEQVYAVAGTLLGDRTSAITAPAPPLAAELVSAVSGACNAMVSHQTLAGTTTGKTFDKHLPAITKFLDHHFDGWSHNKLVQAAFLSMLIELLKDDLRARGVNPSVGVLVGNLGRLPEVFDNAYPGYLEAGMGHVILNHFKKVQLPPKTPVGRKKPRRI